MHRLFTGEAIVLGKRGVGEANTLLALLTREMGVIRAAARSTRVEESKLRFGLEPLTRGTFSFVRGKYEWKLTGVENISRGFISQSTVRRRAAGRIAKLLLRLIHGEEGVGGIYDTTVEGLISLAGVASEQEAENVECILVLRILSELGYVPSSQKLTPLVENKLFSTEILAEATSMRPFLIRTINESLSATGL